MATATPPPFATHLEDLHLRRVSWLLARLPPPVITPIRTLLTGYHTELSWLSALLVREHDVFAIMPSQSGGRIFICQQSSDVTGPDTPRGGAGAAGSLPEDRQVTLHRLTYFITEFNDPIPSRDDFQSYAGIIISFLKDCSGAPSWDESIEVSQHLNMYIVRSSLQKMVTRAGYHCRAMALGEVNPLQPRYVHWLGHNDLADTERMLETTAREHSETR